MSPSQQNAVYCFAPELQLFNLIDLWKLQGLSSTAGISLKPQSTSVYPASSCADISEAGLDTSIITMDCESPDKETLLKVTLPWNNSVNCVIPYTFS